MCEERWECPECERGVDVCPCPHCGGREVVVVRENGARDPVDELDWEFA